MGFQLISIKMPTDYSTAQLKKAIGRTLRIASFTYRITAQSLDARNKRRIHWHLRVAVSSPELKGEAPPVGPTLEIPRRKRDERAFIVGSGPAGLFAALALQAAGFQTTLIDRGADVEKRAAGIAGFEKTGVFDPLGNYAFGEGGAGTFSDGKLTARSKRISKEKAFILQSYIDAGAPEEIAWLTHPHLGSDNLKRIVANLRRSFIDLGGTVHFETMLEDLAIRNGRVTEALCSTGSFDIDRLLIAPGHSAYETYRMLLRCGVPFQSKNFAIGSRVEHRQTLINQAQWGCAQLPGVKAAEYRLTSKAGALPVYTFCMCPGGVVVPAAAYSDVNIVNGMSLYARGGGFANAALVAGVNLEALLGRPVDAARSLDWVEALERRFYDIVDGHAAPACRIGDFIEKTAPTLPQGSSYPLGLEAVPLWEMLPPPVAQAMREGMQHFARQLKGFEAGTVLGLESKTSAPIQALREEDYRSAGFENLYLMGEGSGWAGGIVSSAADGLKAAMKLIEKN